MEAEDRCDSGIKDVRFGWIEKASLQETYDLTHWLESSDDGVWLAVPVADLDPWVSNSLLRCEWDLGESVALRLPAVVLQIG